MTHAESVNETRLAAVLRELDISQAELGRLTQRDKAAISRWVSGLQEPRREAKALILEALRSKGWQGTSVDLWPVDDDDYAASCTRGH